MFNRYAVYFTPEGDLADVGAAWLGWDLRCGDTAEHSCIDGLDVAALTDRPRKYGFHGTVKAPFALAAGSNEPELIAAFAALCAGLDAVVMPQTQIAALGRFLAIVPQGDQALVQDMAATVVRDLDPFRAPAPADELARRRTANLSARQDALLVAWGYPHVMDQYRFHMTLTGPVPRSKLVQVQTLVQQHFAPVLSDPLRIDGLTLVGERPNGRFVQIARHVLGGTT